MKKILFTLLALALLPVFVFAQDCPTPDPVTATVTFKRRSNDPVFSVSGSTKVQFSQGNLQYTKSTGVWSFMTKQYHRAETNTVWQALGVDYANQDVVSLFGWATSGNSASGTYNLPYSTTVDRLHYGESSQSASGEWNAAISDWGQNMTPSDYWRTLSAAEWTYLLNTRTTGVTIGGVSNASWTLARILTDGSGTAGIDNNILGLIIFPDNYTGGTPAGVTWANINSASGFNTTCTTIGWEELEEAGCVFLPCSGNRRGPSLQYFDNVNGGFQGYYWTSTAVDAGQAYSLQFSSDNCAVSNGERYDGCSVRLVHVVE